jgi:hypothetical protein
MFTIEHGFEATTMTLIDNAEAHLLEDVTINTFDDCVTLEKWDLEETDYTKLNSQCIRQRI